MNVTVKGYWIFLFKLEEFLEDFHVILEIKKTRLTVESIYLAQFLVFSMLSVSLMLRGENKSEAWNSGAVTAGYR